MQDETKKRLKEYARNNNLEGFLKELNGDLLYSENELLKQDIEEQPIIFVTGVPRCGSTLMMQWLANIGEIAYPSNMLSRFYKTPIIGSKIQRLLTDEKYNFRNEIYDFSSEVDYSSVNGKTKGALAPNEFLYYWWNYVPEKELQYWTDAELREQMDIERFQKELWGTAKSFGKPFALKCPLLYNMHFLSEILQKSIIIYVKRNPVTNMAAILKARENLYGDQKQWFSHKIKEYPELIKLEDPLEQVVRQVYYIDQAISEGLSYVEEDRKIVVEYEEFCADPKKTYDELAEKLEKLGYKLPSEYHGEQQFKITRSVEDYKECAEVYEAFMNSLNK